MKLVSLMFCLSLSAFAAPVWDSPIVVQFDWASPLAAGLPTQFAFTVDNANCQGDDFSLLCANGTISIGQDQVFADTYDAGLNAAILYSFSFPAAFEIFDGGEIIGDLTTPMSGSELIVGGDGSIKGGSFYGTVSILPQPELNVSIASVAPAAAPEPGMLIPIIGVWLIVIGKARRRK